MKNSLIKLTSIILMLLISHITNAGGYSFNIKIDGIKTINEHKHLIEFKTIDKIDNGAYAYPLNECKTVKIIVNYQYKESFLRRIELFFQLLFSDRTDYDKGVHLLNENIHILKTNLDKIYQTNNIEAFNENPHNPCELYTKTLEVFTKKPFYNEMADFELYFIVR